ncbi:MAG: tRNA nucleotidyltransferase/poly(A) polymerase family protein, partial [Planctomycetota bacterium]
ELEYLGLDGTILDEPLCQAPPTRLGRLPDTSPYATALAAWLLDLHGEDAELEPIALRWATQLLLSNQERADLWTCLEVYRVLRTDWPRLGVARQKRLAASKAFDQALAVVQATDRQDFVDIRRRVLELAESDLAPPPLIDGTDLIAIGFPPGPVFQRVLDAVYDAQLEGIISSHEQAIQLARLVADDQGGQASEADTAS